MNEHFFFKFQSSCFMGILKQRRRRKVTWPPGDTDWGKMTSCFPLNPHSKPSSNRRRAIRQQIGRSSSLQTEWVCKTIAAYYEKWTRRGNTAPWGWIAEKMQIFSLCLELLKRDIDGRIRLLNPPSPPQQPHPSHDTLCGKRFLCQHQGGCETTRQLQTSRDATLDKKNKCPKPTHDFIEQWQNKKSVYRSVISSQSCMDGGWVWGWGRRPTIKQLPALKL